MEKNLRTHYWIMLIPALIWLVMFQIAPMFGIVMAFQDFNPGAGFLHSEFVGLENFRYMLELSDVRSVLWNTLVIAFGKIVGNLFVPLVFALLLNELRKKYLVKFIQTSVYLPHFLSWVILSGIMLQIFGINGPVNHVLAFLGLEPVQLFQRADLFRGFIIGSDVWKNFGFNSIIYLAALTGIDHTLYEAAEMDGAGRWRKMWHVTLPGIRTTIALLAILSLGGILDAGFDQVYNMYNPLVYSTGDIIDTYVYRSGLQELDFSMGTAVGLLKSVVSFILITTGYWLAKKLVGYRIF
ncbi:ABC transporter permease subunit [Cohnella sp. CFH 77786]|uniref:ABC transporter permease n=1 Tax=Cohnella sp. CFH 77786 TaxID=2662265 RepID=UPI001C60B34D|nr:ABC transporter permease subunit [Cohnella sp. CFH 77786]MBW5447592.1 ABC transporter permease subunit [Cohnella sp. CFH 77786]